MKSFGSISITSNSLVALSVFGLALQGKNERADAKYIFLSNSLIKSFVHSIVLVLVAGGITILTGCENSLDKINMVTKNPNFPTVSRTNTEIFYSDSGRVKIRVFATKLERFAQTKEPYINFPDGILVYFYDSAMNIESEISARYAQYFEKKQTWLARNDVVAKNNNKGEQLNTEELYWDESRHKIYSDKFTRVQSADGIFIGENGFEANQNFTWWRLKGTRGTVNMKDEK